MAITHGSKMPSSKVFDLALYKGFNKEAQITFTQQLLNCVPYNQSVYPFPQFIDDAGFPPVDLSNLGSIVSKKIQNNNLILADGSPAEALIILGVPTISGDEITIDVQVAHKTLGGDGGYGYFPFSFEYIGREPVGNIKGLTAKAVVLDLTVNTFYAGFIGAVASYAYNGTSIPTEGTSVSVGEVSIVDITVDQTTGLIYIISQEAFYVLNFATTVLTQINVTGVSAATNFSSITTDDTYVYFSAINDSLSVIIIYEIGTGTFFEQESPFSDQSILFNNIGFERAISTFTGGPQRAFFIASNGAGLFTSLPFDGTSFPTSLIITTSEGLPSDVVNDYSQMRISDVTGVSILMVATDNGFVMGRAVGVTLTFYPFTQFPGHQVTRIAVTNTSAPLLFEENVVGVFTTDETGSTRSRFTVFFGNWQSGTSEFNITAIRELFTTSNPLDLATERQTQAMIGTEGDLYWLGSVLGQGIVTSNTNVPTGPDLTTLTLNYDLVLRDIIKSDIHRYYFLINEVGSSDIDANAILIQYNSDNDTFKAGQPGFFLPTDKLWLAGDVFLLRNLETPSSFYYKVTSNLNLNQTSGSSSASEDEGLINTTEAGNVVDIIYSSSLFYLLGSRGIEVWQNQGASGFPYRKEAYLTIPYHLLPLSDQNLYRIELNRWGVHQGAYVVSCLSNEDNEYSIIKLSGGKYSVLPLNKAAWYAALDLVGAPPEDVTLDVLNIGGMEYMLLSKINSRTTGSRSAAIVIDEKMRIAVLGVATTTQNQYLTVTATNGMQTVFNESTDEFRIQVAPALPSSLNTGTTYVMQSTLLREFAENVAIQTVVIQYAFPIALLNNYPNGTFSLAWSEDEGRTFPNILVPSGAWTENLTTRQLVFQVGISVPSFMLQFVSNSPIVIMNAIVTYTPSGLRT